MKIYRSLTLACAVLLGLVNECLQGLALGAEPEAIVDELRILGHEIILHTNRELCNIAGDKT